VVERIGRLVTDPDELPVPRRSLAIAETTGDRLIGQVSWYWECEQTDWRRLGLVICDERYWGRGYGTRALRLWTSYLFATTDAIRLDFATYSGNPAMIAIGRRLGYVEEGRFRGARRWAGGVHDAVVLGVLRQEWPGTDPAP
jgi:RimJ/RimL family protein N-acetyltransferase